MNNLEVQLNNIGISAREWSEMKHNREQVKVTIGKSYIINFCGMPVIGKLIFKHRDRYQFNHINMLNGEVETGYFLSMDIITTK